MLPIAAGSPNVVLLFAAAGLVIYIASRAAVDALTHANDPSPGKMAIAQWIPIAWTAILATLLGRSEIGIGVVFSTSIAALALDLGVLTIMSPPPPQAHPPAARAWPFTIPAALLALLAGFSGSLSGWHALMMALLGIAIWMVWTATLDGPPQASESPQYVPPRTRRLNRWQFILAIVLAALGAYLGIQAIVAADARTRISTGGLVAAAVMSPLLVLPLLGTGAAAAQNGHMPSAMSTIVAVVLLNLCCLLPIVVACNYLHDAVIAWRGGSHAALELLEALRPVPFPLAVWRVDCVLLIVLGLFLVPVSLGRWTLKKGEGAALALVYTAYLFVSAAVVLRL